MKAGQHSSNSHKFCPLRAAFRLAIGVFYKLGLYRFYIHSRTHLPAILNTMHLRGEGAEVGVEKGQFSDWILSKWRGSRLYSIDPWKEYSSQQYRDASNVSADEQEKRYQEVARLLGKHGDRSVIIRKTSAEAASEMETGQLDFVYIDAQHHYEAVKEDLALWCPKVKPGGIMAGHDYIDGVLSQGVFGVKKAVDEFADRLNLRVHISRGKNEKHPSWFIFLPMEKDAH